MPVTKGEETRQTLLGPIDVSV